jgi:hypothetical protein
MPFESDKIMFEIYREASFSRKYRVVYFTELDENNKEFEINRAMDGEHFYDGFIRNNTSGQAKSVINALLERLNNGEAVSPEQVEEALSPYVPA